MRLDRRRLDGLALQPLHAARNRSKAAVALAQWPPASGQRVVVKDLRQRPLWYRLLYGRHTLKREWKAMQALCDVDGVPGAVAQPDADCIVMLFCEGTPVMDMEAQALSPAVVSRVEDLVTQIHARGVTHGDLHGNNILVTPDGAVSIIDWASACVFGARPPWWAARVFSELCALDRRSVAKIKERHAPHMLSAAEHEMLLRGSSPLYRAVKSLRRVFARVRTS